MREILFRGRSLITNEWVYGDFFKISNHSYISIDGSSNIVKPETVGQYIGLKDRNGVKIFEGDLVRCNNSKIALCVIFDMTASVPKWTLVKQSEWLNNKHSYKHSLEFDMDNKYEVVGDIYNSPFGNVDKY